MRIEKRLALGLVRHAEFVLPGPLSAWGTAMRHEIAYIEPNSDALKWAFGCVFTSYLQRIAYLDVVQVTLIRWLLSAFIASWAMEGLFAARLFYLKSIVWLGLKIDGAMALSFSRRCRQFQRGRSCWTVWRVCSTSLLLTAWYAREFRASGCLWLAAH